MDPLISSGGAVSAIIPEVWSSKWQLRFNDLIVFPQLISRDYEQEVVSLGDTVNIPSFPDVVAGNLQDGARGNSTAITASTTALVINRRSYVDFIITKQAQLQSIPFMSELQDVAIKAIMRKVQDDMIGDIVPSASAPDHQLSYGTSNTLADADLQSVLDLERNANWPDDGKFMVVGGPQYNDIMAIDKFYTKTINNGTEVVNSGKLTAPVYGHQASWTTAMGNTSLFFHQSFMQAATQKQLGMQLFDLGTTGERSFRLNVDVLWGSKQIHNDRVISIQ